MLSTEHSAENYRHLKVGNLESVKRAIFDPKWSLLSDRCRGKKLVTKSATKSRRADGKLAKAW